MRFSDIPGHEDVKDRLRQLVDTDRIPHALLLEGPTGTAKFALARAMAQYIHCTNRTGGDSCGECASCRQHQSFNHIDTVFTFPVVKKSSVGLSDDYIDEFREYITEAPFMDFEKWLIALGSPTTQPQIYVEEANSLIRKLNYTAHNSKYRVVLMWLPEKLREDSANKLLKLIEEPFSDTIFIFTTDNPRAVLPTIYSRTQRIGVKRYPDEVISAYLTGTYNLEQVQADNIAHLANGNISAALRALEVSKEQDTYLELFMQLMRLAYARRVKDLKDWASRLSDLGRTRMIQFYEYAARIIRENFVLNLHIPTLNYLNNDEMTFSSKFSPFINERNVEQLFCVLNDAKADIAANGYAKLVNFDVALKVILLLK